jgi:hypothetical protein
MPASDGLRGTVTVIVCLPERVRCIRKVEHLAEVRASVLGGSEDTDRHPLSIGTSVSTPAGSTVILRDCTRNFT